MAMEYKYTSEQVDGLTLLEMCVLLGAITPDHKIKRLPPQHYLRFTRDQGSREIMRRIHGR